MLHLLARVKVLIMDRTYYIYEHREADTGRTFYVGKGNRKRAWRLDSRNAHWKSIVERHGFTVAIIHEGLTFDRANALEVEMIAAYGLANLANKTAGGGGSSGFTHSAETKARMSDAKKGKPRPPMSEETREKIAAGQRGRKHDQERIDRTRESKKGWRMSAEQRAKAVAVLNANRPTSFSPEHRTNMAAAARARAKPITLTHPEHGTVTATALEFMERYGVHKANVFCLRSGKVRSAKGWRLST